MSTGKFIRGAQAEGACGMQWHETWYYSPEQEKFFWQYEHQMCPLLYALEGIVGTED